MATTPMTSKDFGLPSRVFSKLEDDKITGGQSSFAVLATPRNGQFVFRQGREDREYQDANGNNIPHIEVVIVKMRENISNQYYAKYEKGTHNMPDCFATDGIIPDNRVPNKQSDTCATCPQKKIGSAFTADGKPTKACRDTRKLAVIPIAHLENRMFDNYGGGMLYTVTPTSLKNFNNYIPYLKSIGHRTYTVVTRIRFDPNGNYKMLFTPFGKLSDEQAEIVNELRAGDPRIAAILGEEPIVENGEDDEPASVTNVKPTPIPEKKGPSLPPGVKVKSEIPTPPPPPRMGGFAVTPQTVAQAVSQPAQRPVSQRTVQIEPDEPEEVLDDESDDGLGGELDNELKRLLANGE